MKKINFALFSDAVFFTVCAFFISFTLLRYFFKNAINALMVSSLISLAMCSASLFILLSRRQKFLESSAGKREKRALSMYLSLCGGKEVAKLFLPALPETRMCGNHLESEKTYYRFIFRLSPVNADDIAAFVKLKTGKRKVLFCNDITDEATALCESFLIEPKTLNEVYLLLSKTDLLPEERKKYFPEKRNAFKRIGARLNGKTCFSLLLCGAFLCAYSFFTFYPVYYMISGCTIISLSAACYFVKRHSVRAVEYA